MITPEEREEIINAAVEKALLLLPETVGNLMADQAVHTKMNREFYEEHPEFRDHKDAVASVVEMVEGNNTLDSYEDILKKAVPEIKQRIKTIDKLDMKNVSPTPKRDFGDMNIPQADRLGLHGEI